MKPKLCGILFKSFLVEHLVDNINELLKQLCLPLVIDTPYDLTPSLLLAILESILRSRLPIPPDIRSSNEQGAKIGTMKILLGILEDDILEQDIGLSEIDPRNLAAGNLDEVVFVGQVLCQLGQERLGYRGHSSKEEDHIHVRPSSQANTITNTTTSGYQESETAPTSIFEGSITPNGNRSPPSRPKCIHDLEFPEFSLDDEDFEGDDDEPSRCACNCSIESHGISNLDVAGTSQSSIRYEGFIGRASELEEIREFESKNQRLPRVRYYDIFLIMFNLLLFPVRATSRHFENSQSKQIYVPYRVYFGSTS